MLILQLSLTLVIRISHSKKIMTCDLSLCAELTVISGGKNTMLPMDGWIRSLATQWRLLRTGSRRKTWSKSSFDMFLP